MSFSPIAYNSSFAQVIYPMTEKEAKERDFIGNLILVLIQKFKSIQSNELPDDISNVDDKIYDFVIIGENSQKPFRLLERRLVL